MAKERRANIRRVVRNARGNGGVIDPSRLRFGLDKSLRVLADVLKEYFIVTLESTGRHKIRRDKAGTYANTKVSFTADGVVWSIPAHVAFMDQGRKPGGTKIPVGILIKWIKRYRIKTIGRNASSGKFQKRPTDVNRVAYAMQNSIYKNGIRARPVIEQTLAYSEQMLAAAIDEIIIPDIITIVDFAFKK